MKKWVGRIGGAAGMGFTWAAGWFGVGALMEAVDNILPGAIPVMAFVDIWPMALAIPGFLGGALFAALLGFTEDGCDFEELSLARFAAWGAVGGLWLGVLAVAAGVASAVLPDFALRLAVMIGSMTLLSVTSAFASLALARMARPWRTMLDRVCAGPGAA